MNEFPLHYFVFKNDLTKLSESIETSKENIDKKDLRDKTPLELAIILEHVECAQILAENGADCNIITKQGWNLLQEAVSTGNADLVRLVMKYRNHQRSNDRSNGIPDILNKLKQAPDFYVEMKWEFTSWIPLIAKACPSDVYKVYKSGSNVRIDTTLIGFNGTTWERGNKSFIFKGTQNGASITELDHLTGSVQTDNIQLADLDAMDSMIEPSSDTIRSKLASPNITTYLDTEKIEFERNKSGIWGWRSDKIEDVNGYECKAYAANNLQLITKTRIEHLNEEEKTYVQKSGGKLSNNISLPPFLSTFFNTNEQNTKFDKPAGNVTIEQYFDKYTKIPEYLHRTIEESKKMQTFNATLSLSEKYPLSVHEQLLPIVDLMALTNSHFKKLKEFITLQLPSGFPVKIEIPLYRVITAKITFGNIHGMDHPVRNVTTINENSEPFSTCSEILFEIPNEYSQQHLPANRPYVGPMDEEDILLQLAIQQSLSGTDETDQNEEQLSALEMLGYRGPANNYNGNRYNYNIQDEDAILQRVLAESLMTSSTSNTIEMGQTRTVASADLQDDLQMALELSRTDAQRREALRQQEEDELEQILKLSLIEK